MNFPSPHIRHSSVTLFGLLLVVVAACVGSFGEGTIAAQSQLPIVRVKVDLQPIEVVVKDAQGNPVLGLSGRDFSVLENGKPQEIAFFDAGSAPASLVVLVDSAGSVVSDGRLGSAPAIATQFMRTARPGDDIAAMDFTDQLGPYQQITREQALSPSAVALSAAPGGGSALYDAVASTLCHLRSSRNLRQAVVVISDGVDQHSRITLEQLTGLVRSSRAQLFMIGLQSRSQFNFRGHLEPKLTLVSGHDIDNPDVVFDRLMKESGAESFIPNSESRLEEALKAVADTLPTQYTLAYYPQNTSKTFRKIEVKVSRKGAHVLARRFVGSDDAAVESVHFEEGACTVSPAFHPYAYEPLVTGDKAKVYRDDFADPHSGWPQHENSRYVAGGYELSNPKAKISQVEQTAKSGPLMEASVLTTFRENVIAANGPWWTDFRASATMSASLMPDPRDANSLFPYAVQPAAGLVFRLNELGYYAVLVRGAPGAKQFSLKVVKREFQGDSYVEADVFPWTEVSSSALSTGTEISIESVKNQITLFVHGQQVKTVRDDTFDGGYVGFVVSGPGHAAFKNLVVEQK
jgi:Ca-activated chloride channel family protein